MFAYGPGAGSQAFAIHRYGKSLGFIFWGNDYYVENAVFAIRVQS
jgi:hypothetical protein